MKKKNIRRLPQHVYVQWEQPTSGGEPYLVAYETADYTEDGDRVGIYVLQETKTVRVTRKLQP